MPCKLVFGDFGLLASLLKERQL